MYTLPSRFNVDLVDSVFGDSEPEPTSIEPIEADIPPLRRATNASQFALERIFFERMNSAATEERHHEQCKLFYVPYFVSWETCAIGGIRKGPDRPELDKNCSAT